MRLRIRSNRPARAAMVAVGLAAVLGAAAASVVYVNAERLDIVDQKRTVAKVVTTVERNAALNVVAKEDKWYRVEIGGKQGYVYGNAVSNQPGSSKGKGLSLASVKGVPDPRLDSAAAVKGVGEGTRQYAASASMNTTGLEELIRRREAITPAEFSQFLSSGGLRTATADGIEESTVATAKRGTR